MTDYSTCRRCRKILQVTSGDTVHPLCEPITTKAERLENDLVAAAGNEELEHAIAAELVELVMRPPDMLKEALHYARWGWPVFPLHAVGDKCDGGDKCKVVCQCPKTPATAHGFKDATTDIERIERYWRRHPNANIGTPTGKWFDVIDIDAPKREGMADGTLEFALLKAGDRPDTHAIVTTANRGLHLYIEPEGMPSTTNLMPSVDYRGVGGYVVLPPSTLGPAGWAWLNAPSPIIRQNGARP